jgi:hypothetical protein
VYQRIEVSRAGHIGVELATCYRQAGEIRRAFGVTEVLAGRALTLGTRPVFECERAGILLDLFERDHDPARLIEARRWWASWHGASTSPNMSAWSLNG